VNDTRSSFEHIHYTLGSFSQIIQDGFPHEDFMDAIHWICPQLTALFMAMFALVKATKTHPDFDMA